MIITEEMEQAGRDAISDDGWDSDVAGEMDVAAIFRAMLDEAAPTRRVGLNALLNAALSLTDKREEYCRNAKPCPACNTEQVQLVDWTNGAEWKCRHCKHEWKGI